MPPQTEGELEEGGGEGKVCVCGGEGGDGGGAWPVCFALPD